MFEVRCTVAKETLGVSHDSDDRVSAASKNTSCDTSPSFNLFTWQKSFVMVPKNIDIVALIRVSLRFRAANLIRGRHKTDTT